jgi:hypothetical protein
VITTAELLAGADEDFVVNAYIAVLGRWPDDGGFAHHVARIAGRPQERLAVLRDMAASEEARARGVALDLGPAAAADPAAALAAQLRLRTQFLLREIATLREAARPGAVPPGLAEEQARMAAELAALRREFRERIAALEDARAGAVGPVPAVPEGMADYLLDVVAEAEARMAERLRILERRAFGG